MARTSAVLRAAARTGRIEFDQGEVGDDGSLACVIRITIGDDEWPPVRPQLLDGERFELLAFFEDIIGFGDLPYPASVDCGWAGFPLTFVGSYPGEGSDISLRIIRACKQAVGEGREGELQIPLTRPRTFWPALATVMRWPGHTQASR
jgi:hypothetical protein